MVEEATFWNFSLRFYADKPVSHACLELQDRFGIDVNILLFLLWHASCGRRLTARDLQSVTEASSSWQTEVVRPLRAVRRYLKSFTTPNHSAEINALRQAVKKHELEAERMQQQFMESEFPQLGEVAKDYMTAARENLNLYMTQSHAIFASASVETLLDRLAAMQSARRNP